MTLRWLLLLPALLSALPAAVGAVPPDAPAPSPFGIRAVRLGGSPADPATRAHVEFSLDAGFNALWVRAADVVDGGGGGKLQLDPAFVALLEQLSDRPVRLIVALNPVLAGDGTFTFHDRRGERRIARLFRLLRRRAGVRDFVLDFDQGPARLSDLRDLLLYGRHAAAAHVDLANRLRSRLAGDDRLWLLPTTACDALLDDPRRPYGAELRSAAAKLDRRIGLVWSGTHQLSPTLTAGDLAAARRRLGERPMLLLDRYPTNQVGDVVHLSLLLGPLRGRSPEIAAELAGYVAVPMRELGGSRLALLTVADFLARPAQYDPEASWEAAMSRLSGDAPAALRALRTQAMEWGGWVGERNYRSAATDNPRTAAAALRDPAAVALWGWVVRRYPVRMEALAGLADAAFRNDLLSVMTRRLVVARAMPQVRELRARDLAGRSDVVPLVEALRRERARVADDPAALLAFDRFLAAAGVAGLLEAPRGTAED